MQFSLKPFTGLQKTLKLFQLSYSLERGQANFGITLCVSWVTKTALHSLQLSDKQMAFRKLGQLAFLQGLTKQLTKRPLHGGSFGPKPKSN